MSDHIIMMWNSKPISELSDVELFTALRQTGSEQLYDRLVPLQPLQDLLIASIRALADEFKGRSAEAVKDPRRALRFCADMLSVKFTNGPRCELCAGDDQHDANCAIALMWKAAKSDASPDA